MSGGEGTFKYDKRVTVERLGHAEQDVIIKVQEKWYVLVSEGDDSVYHKIWQFLGFYSDWLNEL